MILPSGAQYYLATGQRFRRNSITRMYVWNHAQADLNALSQVWDTPSPTPSGSTTLKITGMPHWGSHYLVRAGRAHGTLPLGQTLPIVSGPACRSMTAVRSKRSTPVTSSGFCQERDTGTEHLPCLSLHERAPDGHFGHHLTRAKSRALGVLGSSLLLIALWPSSTAWGLAIGSVG